MQGSFLLRTRMLVDIEGYFCIKKEYPDLTSLFLDQKSFKISVRRFELINLKISSNLTKFAGNIANSQKLVAVFDVKGSLIPFFIPEEKANKLKFFQNSYSAISI